MSKGAKCFAIRMGIRNRENMSCPFCSFRYGFKNHSKTCEICNNKTTNLNYCRKCKDYRCPECERILFEKPKDYSDDLKTLKLCKEIIQSEKEEEEKEKVFKQNKARDGNVVIVEDYSDDDSWSQEDREEWGDNIDYGPFD